MNNSLCLAQATRYPHIKIVNPSWLYDSISHWRREPEERYLIVIQPEDRQLPMQAIVEENSGPLLSSEDDEDSDDEDSDDEDGYDSDLQPNTNNESVNNPLDMSNVGWKDVDEEFAEFFGEDDDFEDSDTESVRSDVAGFDLGKRKRMSAGGDTTMTDGESAGEESAAEETASDVAGSRLAKRQKVARERAAAGSTLRDVEPSMDDAVESESDSDSLADELERELMGLGDDLDEALAAAAAEDQENERGGS